jgi:hypothetical protein
MSKYPTAFFKVCDRPIKDDDGKVDKKGMWTCTDCLIKQDKGGK